MRSALLLVLVLVLALPVARGAEPPSLNPQQQRMRDCNQRAGEQGLKGSARQQFMRRCLSGGKVEVQFGAADTLPRSVADEAGQPVEPDSEEAAAPGPVAPAR